MKLSLRPKRSKGPETYAEAEALAAEDGGGEDRTEGDGGKPTVGRDLATGRWTSLRPQGM